MRILTWNINGLRTLPQYHPWNTFKSLEGILEELSADIICFQEVKTTRANITRQIALPGHYDAFFSLPHTRHGYSGVAVFTNSHICVPLKAEEGLSGRLGVKHTRPPLSDEEKISPVYPTPDDIDLMPDEQENTPSDLLELDREGRALMLDFGLFVLVNLYCPNETSDARLPYKMNYHRLLSERVRRLVEVEGREVVVVGDINVCAEPVDHADWEYTSGRWARKEGGNGNESGYVEEGKEEGDGDGDGEEGGGFWVHPARKWFQDWLAPRGPMHDVVRECWPDRKGMYTCWNTKISARASNYGTRIDYILLTKGLLPWFKHGDIVPSVKGSDHCPVYVDLHDEIMTEEGRRTLREAMGMGMGMGMEAEVGLGAEMKAEVNGERRARMPPRLSARHWDEFSGKQKLLSSFFGKKSNAVEVPVTPPLATPSTSAIAPLKASLTSKGTIIVDDNALQEAIPTSSVILPPSSSQPQPSDSQTSEPTAPSATPTLTLVDGNPSKYFQSTPIASPSKPCSRSPTRLRSSSPPPSAQRSSSSKPVVPVAAVASKRKKPLADSNYSDGSSKKKSKTAKTLGKTTGGGGQAKLSAFFAGPSTKAKSEGKGVSASTKSSGEVKSGRRKKQSEKVPSVSESEPESKGTSGSSTPTPIPIDVDDLFSPSDEPCLATIGTRITNPHSNSSNDTSSAFTAADDAPLAWSHLFTKPSPPRCLVHGEPTMELRVTKQGPNRGKAFYLCSRPVGPGYDAGKSVRAREDVNPEYRCNFFKWASEVRREAIREGKVIGASSKRGGKS